MSANGQNNDVDLDSPIGSPPRLDPELPFDDDLSTSSTPPPLLELEVRGEEFRRSPTPPPKAPAPQASPEPIPPAAEPNAPAPEPNAPVAEPNAPAPEPNPLVPQPNPPAAFSSVPAEPTQCKVVDFRRFYRPAPDQRDLRRNERRDAQRRAEAAAGYAQDMQYIQSIAPTPISVVCPSFRNPARVQVLDVVMDVEDAPANQDQPPLEVDDFDYDRRSPVSDRLENEEQINAEESDNAMEHSEAAMEDNGAAEQMEVDGDETEVVAIEGLPIAAPRQTYTGEYPLSECVPTDLKCHKNIVLSLPRKDVKWTKLRISFFFVDKFKALFTTKKDEVKDYPSDAMNHTLRRARMILFKGYEKARAIGHGFFDCRNSVFTPSRHLISTLQQDSFILDRSNFSEEEWEVILLITRVPEPKFEVVIQKELEFDFTKVTDSNRVTLVDCLQTITSQELFEKDFLMFGVNEFFQFGGAVSPCEDGVSEVWCGFKKTCQIENGADGRPRATISIDLHYEFFYKPTTVFQFVGLSLVKRAPHRFKEMMAWFAEQWGAGEGGKLVVDFFQEMNSRVHGLVCEAPRKPYHEKKVVIEKVSELRDPQEGLNLEFPKLPLMHTKGPNGEAKAYPMELLIITNGHPVRVDLVPKIDLSHLHFEKTAAEMMMDHLNALNLHTGNHHLNALNIQVDVQDIDQ